MIRNFPCCARSITIQTCHNLVNNCLRHFIMFRILSYDIFREISFLKVRFIDKILNLFASWIDFTMKIQFRKVQILRFLFYIHSFQNCWDVKRTLVLFWAGSKFAPFVTLSQFFSSFCLLVINIDCRYISPKTSLEKLQRSDVQISERLASLHFMGPISGPLWCLSNIPALWYRGA